MAIFHCHVSAVSASSGHSAVASAAYQAREELTHEQQRIGSTKVDFDNPDSKKLFSADKRALTKGEVSENLRKVFRDNGIKLSDDVIAQKDNRYKWTINDNGKEYTVKAFRETGWKLNEDGTKWTDPETKESKGKRIVTGQGLDIYADKVHRYNTKEDLRDKWIKTDGKDPPNSGWVKDRGKLWNQTSQSEIRRDGVEAFKYTVGLQRELTEQQNKNAINDWIDKEFTSKGAIVDIAIHRVKATDSTPKNPLYNDHAHIMVTTRKLSADGKSFAKTKNEEIGNSWQNNINSTKERDAQILEWRKSWEKTVNQHLETAGSDARIDHRSHKDRGLEQLPEIHMGAKASNAEKKGIQTKRGDRNETRKFQNPQKEKKQGWWSRIKDIPNKWVIPRHKPIEKNSLAKKQPSEKRAWDWKKFLQRQWRSEYIFNAATERFSQIQRHKPLAGKPIEQQEKKLPHEKQVDRQEIENRIKKEVAKNLPKQSHVERVKQQGEHHGIKR